MNDAPEVIVVQTSHVMCDGGGGPLGHPRVYYTIGAEGYVVCGYCDRCFVLAGGPADKGAEAKDATPAAAEG